MADVGKSLDPLLWSPESFLREFGEQKSDFFNCTCGTLLQNQPMKKFWEGFDNIGSKYFIICLKLKKKILVFRAITLNKISHSKVNTFKLT